MPTRRATLAGLASLAAVPAAASTRLVVAELFTSQGCSSCPPADMLLHALSRRADVLPLAFHVTYWNSLGWRDPYSLDLATARQRAYATQFGTRTVYTPQLVVDGRIDVVGSDRRGVIAALEQAAATPVTGPDLRISATPDGIAIRVGEGRGTARILAIGFDAERQTQVGRGENAGRTLIETNIVRAIADAGAWDGHALALTVARPAGERVAVLLQSPGGGYLAVAQV